MSPFLQYFYQIVILVSAIASVAGLAVYIFFRARVSGIAGYKEKHDFLANNYYRYLKLTWFFIGLAACCAVNLYEMNNPALSSVGLWFFVRIFFGLAAGTLIVYVSFLVINYYSPGVLNRELKKWRFMPRINPTTGNTMRLLSENEEDVHLDMGMISEENIFSVDYDVWIDPQNGEVKIEKYPGHLHAVKCNNCSFHTMKVVKEEIVERDESGSPKELLKHYQCSFCKSVRKTIFTVSSREADDYRKMELKFSGISRTVELIKMEIYSALDGKKAYEFKSPAEATKFLNELDKSSKL
ncbi:MAG: hypothetical protein FJZ78_10705 [Bacteroidetes bacterium]|nr:hypothetical protein [Bacteroidota bacterium]